MQRLDDPFVSSHNLSHAVVEAGDMLGLERADVATIIHFIREGAGALYEGRALIEPGSEAWDRSKLFVELYLSLDDAMGGNQAKMVRWLHTRNPALKNEEPLVVLEDQGRLEDVLNALKREFGLT